MTKLIHQKSNNTPILSDEQARHFAVAIMPDIAKYISEHSDEHKAFVAEQTTERGDNYNGKSTRLDTTFTA